MVSFDNLRRVNDAGENIGNFKLKCRSSKLPSIVLIPAIEGNTGDGMRALHEAVEKAVGSDILN